MKLQKDILKKYLNGRFSLIDKNITDEYLLNENYQDELQETLTDHWNEIENSSSEHQADVSLVLEKINHNILLKKLSEKPARIVRFYQSYAKVAAILLVPILLSFVGYFYLNQNKVNDSWAEIQSPFGARTQFTLPDGSEVWLNGGSVLKYRTDFAMHREIKLNGEAFFEVTKNPHALFTIDSKSIDIRVLGTSFNVVSYDLDSIAEVVVNSGKVQVVSDNKKLIQNLLPNERLVYNSNSQTAEKSNVNVENFISWKSGKLMFLNDDLDEVLRKLSRFYSVDFIVDEKIDHKQQFRALMEEESLEEVLSFMKLTMDINYEIKKRQTDNNGKLLKKEIFISN